jgi:hypothetical protein
MLLSVIRKMGSYILNEQKNTKEKAVYIEEQTAVGGLSC